jgi:thiol-disulfide isomerase/thioredoxin
MTRRLAWSLALALTVAGVAGVTSFVGAPAARAQIGQARPWIGIAIEAGTHGVRIKEVRDKTPAKAAGLLDGDEVLSIDGKVVKQPAELIGAVQEKGVGSKVALVVRRGDKELKVELQLAARPDEQQMLRDHLIGKPAPAFVTEKVVGPHAASLADLKGNVVVVEFWATWCGPCKSTIPTLSGWQKKYGGKGLRVVGVSTEDTADLKRFLGKQKIAYTVARDPAGKTSSSWSVPAIPTIVIIDRDGVVRFAEVGGGSNLDAAEKVFVGLLDTPAAAAPAAPTK